MRSHRTRVVLTARRSIRTHVSNRPIALPVQLARKSHLRRGLHEFERHLPDVERCSDRFAFHIPMPKAPRFSQILAGNRRPSDGGTLSLRFRAPCRLTADNNTCSTAKLRNAKTKTLSR